MTPGAENQGAGHPGRAGDRPVCQAWIVDLAATEAEVLDCLAVLAPDERTRAARFARAQDRHRFVVSHAAWRFVLARALHADPRALSFSTGPTGKPDLAGPWAGCFDVNLSHSGDFALVGLSTIGPIGVDVEMRRPIPDMLSIARHHFARSEVVALEGCDATALPDAFLACWTRKEAVVKAMGLGLSLPLDRFAVTVPPKPAALLSIADDHDRARGWTLHHVEPSGDSVGAVAVAAPGAACTIHRLAAGWTRTLAANLF